MYNVFKRPMFRKGGSTQGQGIMSHVEPRVQANSGYFGQTPIYPQPFSTMNANAAMGMGDGRVQMMKSFPMNAQSMGASSNFRPEIDYGSSAPPKFDVNEVEDINTTDEFITIKAGRNQSETTIRNPNYKPPGEYKTVNRRGQKVKVFVPYDDETIESMKVSETGDNVKANRDMQSIIADAEKSFVADKANKNLLMEKEKITIGDNDGKLTLDIMEEVEGEKKILNKLLKNDKFTRGENALIIAQALNTPGGINEKIAAATKAALPVARSRAKEDKAVTLAAYKYAKDKEKTLEAARIKADTPSASQKGINEQINQAFKFHKKDKGTDAMSMEDFRMDWYRKNATPGVDQQTNIAILKSYGKSIETTLEELRENKINLQKEQAKGKKAKESMIKLYTDGYQNALGKINYFKSNPAFEGSAFDKMFISIMGQAVKDGGRIGYALGTKPEMMSQNFTEVSQTPKGIEEVSATEVDTAGAITAEKPVINLDYATLRKRLPPEINDQVVALLASSEKALQDFAYIQTQSDVERFNVTYGVNLVIPPQTQQA